MKKSIKYIIIILVLGGIFFYTYWNSYNAVVRREGLDVWKQVAEYTDANGDFHRVVAAFDEEGEPVLADFVKKKIRGWSEWLISPEDGKLYTMTSWFGDITFRIYNHGNFLEDEHEDAFHYVCFGDNAKKLIVFEEGQLPDNTTVSIEQYTNNYILHFITHSMSGDGEIQIMNNLSDVLIDGGFIEVE